MNARKFSADLQFIFIAVLILRLFFAYEWLNSGIGKLQNIIMNPDSYFAQFQNIFANVWTKNNPYEFMIYFLKNFAAPNAKLVIESVAIGEALVGISLLLGFLVRPASIIGMILNAIYFLAAGHTSPSTAGINFIMFGGGMFIFLVSAGRAYGIDAIIHKKFHYI